MNCHEHEADLVDLARGMEPSDQGASLRGHLETCPDCKARLARERQISAALRSLARAADAVPVNRAAEQRLLAAFDARQAPPGDHVAVGGRTGWQRWALAAAASLVMMACGWWAVMQFEGGAQPAPASPSAPATSAKQPSSPSNAPASRETPRLEASATPAQPTATLSSKPPRPRRPDPPAPATRPADADTADESDEFVELPAADRLPRFESGMIVRVELPVSSLPAYGIPIMPDAARSPVTADVLVGQDGQPRAIRLVSMPTRSRRR